MNILAMNLALATRFRGHLEGVVNHMTFASIASRCDSCSAICQVCNLCQVASLFWTSGSSLEKEELVVVLPVNNS